MDKDHRCFLKVSGYIHANKKHEFEQTVTFVFNHLPNTCLGHSLTVEVTDHTHYHLYSLWQSENSLFQFKTSREFEFLKGAFQTLGQYDYSIGGRWAETQLFETILMPEP